MYEWIILIDAYNETRFAIKPSQLARRTLHLWTTRSRDT